MAHAVPLTTLSTPKDTCNGYFSATNLRKFFQSTKFFEDFLLLVGTKLLYVDGVLHLQALQNRGLVELLAATKFLHDAGFFKLSLKLLKGLLNVLAFFYRYNNHFAFCFKYLIVKLMLLGRAHEKRVQSYYFFA